MKTSRLPAWLVRGTVRLIVALLVASSATPIAHTFDPHETDCCPTVVIHNASQHRIGADPGVVDEGASDHCAACHLARPFSSPGLNASGSPALGEGVACAYDLTCVRHTQLDLRVPARAPPALV